MLDPALQDHQLTRFEEGVRQILRAGYTYRVGELAEAWVAMRKRDLRYRGRLHRDDSMHCGHFVRDCLRGAGCDPLGPGVLPENTVPELIARAFPVAAKWHAPQAESKDAGT